MANTTPGTPRFAASRWREVSPLIAREGYVFLAERLAVLAVLLEELAQHIPLAIHDLVKVVAVQRDHAREVVLQEGVEDVQIRLRNGIPLLIALHHTYFFANTPIS